MWGRPWVHSRGAKAGGVLTCGVVLGCTVVFGIDVDALPYVHGELLGGVEGHHDGVEAGAVAVLPRDDLIEDGTLPP